MDAQGAGNGMGGVLRVELLQDRRGWGVEVETWAGAVRRYRYGSEAQARFFAAVFEMGPRVLPPVSAGRRRRTRRAA
ncbi:hypothetical protein [Myxococcus vastator]|uniref:hypothetical protein n=1 Tax=Myxococcus vastator TaxID=2709664 RepID=UPI0013D30519|nr:hypothetical protein [Myxococcus vastator]